MNKLLHKQKKSKVNESCERMMRIFHEIVVPNKYANWTMCVGMPHACLVEADDILMLIQLGIVLKQQISNKSFLHCHFVVLGSLEMQHQEEKPSIYTVLHNCLFC